MLKDGIRTESYRDFIYENKDLFRDKIVLDVGCGTGILSMFCAKAGAKHVYAVDNASIIDKAREIIYENNLADIVSCYRGKVEDISLPVDVVDVIISEWMGYCLLFEAMLDSVIWARDRYLKKPGGLMVPSHCTIHLAPMNDPVYVTEEVDFWHDVYGFSMKPILNDIYDTVAIRQLLPESLAASSVECYQVPIHSITVAELNIVSSFEFTLSKDVECLDGWAVWFDTFFSTSSTVQLPKNSMVENWKNSGSGYVAFTSGPYGPETHWKSGSMLIKRTGSQPAVLKRGQKLRGVIRLLKDESDSRALNIDIKWEDDQGLEAGSQTWRLC